jgi:hypothetical protein
MLDASPLQPCAPVAPAQVKASDAEAELRQAKTEAAAMQLDSDLATVRVRVQQLEAAVKARDKDVERLQRAIDQCKAAEVRTPRLVCAQWVCAMLGGVTVPWLRLCRRHYGASGASQTS